MKTFLNKHIFLKPLWINILYGIGFFLFLILIFIISLNWITRFNKILKVPNVTGQNLHASKKFLEEMGFGVEIQDSIYVDGIAKNAIVKQNPDVDEIVKYGRTIYLTINRSNPPNVEMPNLIGFSLESAIEYLKSIGLKINQTIYRNDVAFNIVLDVKYNNNPIESGTKLLAGTGVDLIVGNGISVIEMDVPNIIGLTVDIAKQNLKLIGLQLGEIKAISSIIDTNLSYIVDQSPSLIASIPDSTGLFNKNKIKTNDFINITISHQLSDTSIAIKK